MQDQAGAGYFPCLSTDYSGLSGCHGQDVNSTRITSIAYPGTSVPGPSFHTLPYPKICEEGPSYFHQQGSAYAIPRGPHVLSCDRTSQVPATVSDKVLYDPRGNQGTGAYPANAPAEQRDAQVSWRYTSRLTRSPTLFLLYSPIFTIQAVLGPMFSPADYMEPPYVAPSPLKNEVAITSASPESSIVHGNVDCEAYPAHPTQWDARVAWRSTFHRPELFMTPSICLCRRP